MFLKKKKEAEATPKETEVTPKEEQASVVGKVGKGKTGKSSSFFRVSSFVLCLGLLGFSLYCVSARIISGQDGNAASSYLTLNGKTTTETKNLLAAFGKEKQRKANDYGFIGTKFFLSENKITPNSILEKSFFRDGTYHNLALYDITHSTTKVYPSDVEKGKVYLDFSKAVEGEYFVYPFSDDGSISQTSDYNFYSLSSQESVMETVYSLPDADGERTRITFRNNRVSPFSMFQVKKVGSILPEDCYDAVLFYREYNGNTYSHPSEESLTKLKSIATSIQEETHYKLYVASTMEEALSVKATLSLALSSNTAEIYTTLFTSSTHSSFKTSALEETELKGYDAIPEIRESLGYFGEATKAYTGVAGNEIPQSLDGHIGKEPFLLHDEKADILALLEQL